MNASGVWKLYASGDSTIEAVRGVDVSLGVGEMVAIMGPSGCGKTTLLNVLSGIDVPTAGHVTVNDLPLFGISDNQRTSMRSTYLGFIFQDFNLLPVLSAVENVELPLLLLGIAAGEARKRAQQALEDVGIGDRSQHRPSELSGGQQQRVAVARAIVHRPAVVLCDEPTGNLDTKTSTEVLDLLKRINKEHKTTFLIVTHDASIADLCDRVLQMEDGIMIGDSSRTEEE
jgi:putative ABC transport system ATP-binding protein|tara:strand:- start:29 stop:715 length:687 start_codon:yes stop_codon:yes gene_type:complete